MGSSDDTPYVAATEAPPSVVPSRAIAERSDSTVPKWRTWPFWDRWLTIVGFALGVVGFPLAVLGLWLAVDAADQYFQPQISLHDREPTNDPLGSPFRITNDGKVTASNVVIKCTSQVFDYRAGDDGPPLGTGGPHTNTTVAPFSDVRPGDGFEVMCDRQRAMQYWSADFVDVVFEISYDFVQWRWPRTTIKAAPVAFRFRSAETPDRKKVWTQLPVGWDAPPVSPRIPNISEEALRRVIQGDLQICDDAACRKPRSDVVGVMIESSPFVKSKSAYREIFPTRVRGLKLNQRVTWVFGDHEWAPAWYRDPKTRQVRVAWQAQREFIGRVY